MSTFMIIIPEKHIKNIQYIYCIILTAIFLNIQVVK